MCCKKKKKPLLIFLNADVLNFAVGILENK